MLKRRIKNLSLSKEEAINNSKWLISQAKPFRWQIVILLLISLFSLSMSFVGTVAGKFIVDATTSGVLNMKYVLYMVCSTLFSILFSACTKLFNDYINEKFSFGMRCRMFDRAQRSQWLKLSEFHSADVVTRLTSDVSYVASGIISIVPSIVVTFLQLLIAFGVLFHFDKILAIFALIIGPIGTSGAIFFRKKYKYYQIKLRESESEYRSFMQENMSQISVIKAFQREDHNNEYMNSIKNDRMKIIMKSSKLSVCMSSFMRLIYSGGYVVAFCWCAFRISSGKMTYGTMTVFLSLVSQVQGSISSLSHVIPQIYSMLISAKRITDIINIEEEKYSDNKSQPEEISVKVKDLTFAYKKRKIFENISFDINPGEKIGIVGESGAGKTTLIRLLLSLITPTNGEIEYIDENGNSETAEPSSRRFLSYVPQGNTLLSGTIEKNLLVGNENATEKEMWNALYISDADRFVKECEEGLQTVLSEKAGGLSEGQAQRISIARALIRNKPVLILDEATSALDEKTEATILSRLSESCNKTTCFIITHRRSMLKYCDRVIEFDENSGFSIKDL